ncbi:mucolipin-3 isoform X2 [Brachyhypopomus gauderio]|uniref:mucolipin-3 isoform X2 n=1 Tax=Brachyhypopomus gauderio TaxID=698409 RepID=UPI0040410640
MEFTMEFLSSLYLNLQNVTLGNHAFETVNGEVTPLSLCQEFYRHGNISPGNETFDIDPHVDEECMHIYPVNSMEYKVFPNAGNFTIHFKRLLSVNINMKVKAINLQTVRHDELPDCYNFNIMIVFDNRAHSGQIRVSLNSDAEMNECKDWTISDSNAVSHFLLIVLFDSLVMVVCLLSLGLCSRSVHAGVHLLLEYVRFVSENHGTVSWADRMEFINGWYILIILSDLLTITGSVLKICIQSKELADYNVCSIVLGTSTVLVWLGVLRYLGFFRKYNVLILTLRAALPNVVRFSFCAVLIYLSYCFCGWIVLGPHHENFRSFNTVAYCLFSMINGDEIYSTFSKLRERSSLVWFFSRIYIYSFISIFTYMVLSLFIAIITETYENIKVRMSEQQRCTRSAHVHTLSPGTHTQPRCTHSTQLHAERTCTRSTQLHAQRRYTRSTQVHTLNAGTHTQHSYTLNAGTHTQHSYMLNSHAHTQHSYTLNAGTHTQHSYTLNAHAHTQHSYTLNAGTHTQHSYMLNAGTHTQRRCKHSTQVHTLNAGTHTQHRYTHSTQVHTLNAVTHAQRRCTRSTQVHTLNAGAHTQHSYMLKAGAHTQRRCTHSTQVHTLNTVTHTQHRYTHSTQVHTLNTGTHTQRRYTHSAQVHTLNAGTHTQRRYTHSTQVHTLNAGTHIQPRYTHSTQVHTLNAGTHIQPRYTHSTQVHTLNAGTQTQHRYTHSTQVHTFSPGATDVSCPALLSNIFSFILYLSQFISH